MLQLPRFHVVLNGNDTMVAAQNKLPRLMAWAITGLGLVMFASYLLYLPMPAVFDHNGQHNGLIFYSLATAGAGFVAWGIMLAGMDDSGIGRSRMLGATAVGFAMLSLMRLETAIFPTPPFDAMRALPIGECVMFAALAFWVYRIR